VRRSLAIRFSLVVLGAVTGVVTARALHADGRGAYAILVALASAAIALGGLSVEQAGIALWPGRRDAIAANAALLGPLLGGLAGTVAFAVAATGLAGRRAFADPGLLAVALLAVPASTTVLFLAYVLLLRARVSTVDKATLLGSGLQCGALLVLAAAGRLTLGWVIVIWTACTAVPLLPMLAVARLRLRYADARLALRTVSLGLRYHPGSAALYLTYRLDVLILGALSTTTAVGRYTLAVTLAELVRVPTDALSRASLARQAADDLSAVAAATVRVTRASLLLAAICVGGLCLVAPVLVPATYGHDFAASVPALYALAPGVFALGAARQLTAYLVRLGRPMAMSSLSIAALAVNVAANLVLIPRWGIVGCALSSSVSYTLIAAVQVRMFCRATGTAVRALSPRLASPLAVISLGRRALLGGRSGSG
jgi:O-antigen/teichoic acid export membrane protein